jgi:hypothetical protein
MQEEKWEQRVDKYGEMFQYTHDDTGKRLGHEIGKHAERDQTADTETVELTYLIPARFEIDKNREE